MLRRERVSGSRNGRGGESEKCMLGGGAQRRQQQQLGVCAEEAAAAAWGVRRGGSSSSLGCGKYLHPGDGEFLGQVGEHSVRQTCTCRAA